MLGVELTAHLCDEAGAGLPPEQSKAGTELLRVE